MEAPELRYRPITDATLPELVTLLTAGTWEFFSRTQLTEADVLGDWERGAYAAPDAEGWLVDGPDGRLLGMVRLFDLGDPTARFDVRLAATARGRGIGATVTRWVARRVFRHPGITSLEANTRADNVAMRRTLRRCGFVKEGHHRAADPAGHDWVSYALLRRDLETGTTTRVHWHDEPGPPPRVLAPGSDPFERLRSWVGAARAAGEPNPLAATLATASAEAAPSARVVQLQGVEAHALVFTTRSGTRKWRDLTANPSCTLTFWWPTIGRQARLACDVDPLEDGELATLFAGRPRAHQLATAVSRQGSEVADVDGLRSAAEALDAELGDRPVPRPASLVGYRARPHTIELWSERDDRLHERLEFQRRDGGWHQRLLAP